MKQYIRNSLFIFLLSNCIAINPAIADNQQNAMKERIAEKVAFIIKACGLVNNEECVVKQMITVCDGADKNLVLSQAKNGKINGIEKKCRIKVGKDLSEKELVQEKAEGKRIQEELAQEKAELKKLQEILQILESK